MTDDDIAKARAEIAASPPTKEWDCDAYDRGDTTEEDGYESSDYVDGWNDALAACQPWIAGLPAALDEVERLRGLHAQNERMCAEIERLDGEVAKLTASCTVWQALGGDAAATLHAQCDVLDRVATIASEAFGPFPVQSAEANLTAIEQGIAKLRAEVERQTKLHDLAERAMRSAHEAWATEIAASKRYLDAKEPLEVVADAARAVVDAQDATDEPSPVAEEVRALARALDGLQAKTRPS